MVRLTDHPAMTIAVDLGCKAAKQTNKNDQRGALHSHFFTISHYKSNILQ